MTFVVDVTFTDRSRAPDGHYREFWARVTVLASHGTEAELIACQMVAATRSDLDAMVLGSVVCI